MQYKIISANTTPELEGKVQEMLDAGWDLQGGVVTSDSYDMTSYYQAIIKKS
jgi:hypothetical protein